MIGGVSFVLPFGSCYALFDTKKLYNGSVVTFLVGSALCGAAPNLNAFIVGRVIAGVGGIGIYLGIMTLLSVNTTPTERPVYLGLVQVTGILLKSETKLTLRRGLTFGVGNVLGPVIGGSFADSKATWRWGFYMNLCIIGLLGPVYLFVIPSFKPQRSRGILSRLKELDGAGTILSIGSIVCLVMAINFGGTLYSWDSAQIIVLFIMSGILLVVFALQQGFTFLTKETSRLFPVMFLRDKEALLLFILTATFNSAGFIPIYYIPTYFQFTRGDMPLEAAVRLLPLIAFVSFLILVNGGVLSRGGYYMPWFLVGSILTMIAGVLFCEFSESCWVNSNP